MSAGLRFAILLGATWASGVAAAEGTRTITVEIPPGALPLGPAVAQIEREDGSEGSSFLEWPAHRIRFEMPAGAMPLQFWTGFVDPMNPPRYAVHARSDTGASWDLHGLVPTAVESEHQRLFVGTADELAAMSRAAHLALPDEADDLMRGFELSPAELAPEPGCAELTRAKLVVFAEPLSRKASQLRRCAALGASLVVIASGAGGEAFGLPDLSSGRGTPWGMGRYGWSNTLDRSAVTALRDVARSPGLSAGAFASLAARGVPSLLRGRHPHAPSEDPSVDGNAILGLLVVYVLALAAVGAWGVRRPKRAIWLWLAFPATAVVASIAVAIAGAVTDPEVSHLDVELSDLMAPGGDGLESVSLDLHARAPGTFDVATPWTSGWLELFQRERGFRGPFSVDAPPSAVIEDRLEGRLSFPQLNLTHRSDALLGMSRVISGPAPYLRRGSEGVEIVNPTDAPLLHAALFADGKRIFVDDVPAGGKKSLPAGKQENVDSAPSWLGKINQWDADRSLDRGAYLLAAVSVPASVPTARPSNDPSTTRSASQALPGQVKRVLMTIGPLPGGIP